MYLKAIILLIVFSVPTGSQVYELKCWTVRNHTRYGGPGLQKSSNIDDAIECLKKCREKDLCHAVDIDTSTKPNCWYQQKGTFWAHVKDLRPANTVTNYFFNPLCGKVTQGVDVNCWTVTAGRQLKGLTQTNKGTLAECLSACAAKSDCLAVDWDDATSPKCWIQTMPLEVSLSKLSDKATVTNFILNRDCLKRIAGIDMTFWKVSNLRCYAPPGLVQVDRFDLKSCLEYCQNNDACTMVDYDPPTKPPCWAQTKPFEIKRGKLVVSKTCSNYLFNRDAYKKVKKSPEIPKKPEIPKMPEKPEMAVSSMWRFRNNTDYVGNGLTTVPSVQNLNQCLSACYKNSLCRAATFTLSAKDPCAHVVLDGSVNYGDFSGKEGVTSYVLCKDCSK